MDEAARCNIEESIRDAAVTVPCEDEDMWNSRSYMVLSRVAVLSPLVSDVNMGPAEMCRRALAVCSSVAESGTANFMAVLMCCATRQHTIFSRAVAVIGLSRDEKVGIGLGNHTAGVGCGEGDVDRVQ
jgi:hypothetical protein